MAEQKNSSTASWTSLLSVPGNIKQQYLPFVLNPKCKEYTEKYEKSEGIDLKTMPAQYFSFKKPLNPGIYKAGFGRLNVCPSSLTSDLFAKLIQSDISFRSLHGHGANLMTTTDGLDAWTIINSLPSVQVREYLPDLKIDQLMNIGSGLTDLLGLATNGMFSNAGKAFMDRINSEGWGSIIAAGVDSVASGLLRVGFNIVDLMSWFMNGKEYHFAADANSDVKSYAELVQDHKDYKPYWRKNNVYSDNAKHSIVDFPFMMYYKLLSYVTTNIYEFPCKIDEAYNIQGSAGWNSGSQGLDNDWIDKIPGLGKILKMSMFSNIRINYVAHWDPKTGHTGMSYPALKVNFSLFNDTLESAINNFIFVNTIAPNNMWIQMGLIMHSSAIYDVKIEGHSRMYACMGDVTVKFKGQLRDPSVSFINTLVNKHLNANGNLDKKFKNRIIPNRLIKIPDVYDIEINFKSLFPANFNNFLYHYAHNVAMDTEFANGGARYPGLITSWQYAMQKHNEDLKKQENQEKMEAWVQSLVGKMDEGIGKATNAAVDATKNATKNVTTSVVKSAINSVR